MKTHLGTFGTNFTQTIAALALAGLVCGCGRGPANIQLRQPRAVAVADPLAIVLAPHVGDARVDEEIRERQAQVRAGVNVDASLERLGWLFVAKARETFDPGFYVLAERCAAVIDTRHPGSAEALLLRGHALHSEHRFAEAETIARELVNKRGLAFDHGLLGDVLVDVGRVDEAARAYQTMLDLKPDPQGYARAAHVRWIKGDLAGALELMRMVARGANPRDPEPAAWMHTQLARYAWQSQRDDEAMRAIDGALSFHSNYPPALLLRGRMFLAVGNVSNAIDRLRVAAKANPLPEYEWVLAEAMRVAGRTDEANKLEAELSRTGACSDPRTFALFLATRGTNSGVAVQLARAELENRADVFTHDALAWALAAVWKLDEAQAQMSRAVVHGTQDPRMVLHAAVICAKSGDFAQAHQWLHKIDERFLLPSELAQLRDAVALIRQPADSRVAVR